MKIAVLSLTRDRLDYTRHCFASLHAHAGCDYDHYVLDQGSDDWTYEWLRGMLDDDLIQGLARVPENIGISAGMNRLLAEFAHSDVYDVVVKFDNDCELTQPNTLRDVAQLAYEGGCLLSPRILGLKNPPQPTRTLRIGTEEILDVPQIGGIFLAAPAWVYDEFRYSESNPIYGGDDVEICQWFRQQGGTCGYVKRLEAWHFETTVGQMERFPRYFARKYQEAAA